MNQKLQSILDRIPAQWGKWIQVDKGWHDILVDLDCKLAALDPSYEVFQVKEKFGGLRYYCSLETDEARELIQTAEEKAAVTCEQCGQPGKSVSIRGWIKTLCPPCQEVL